GDLGQRQLVAVVLGDLLGAGVLHDVEALGVGLHHAVLDAVGHLLHEEPQADRAAVEVPLLRGALVDLAPARALDRPDAGGERAEDRIHALHDLVRPADHQAVAALEAPDAAGRADVDVVDPVLGADLGAADVVLEVHVAAA